VATTLGNADAALRVFMARTASLVTLSDAAGRARARELLAILTRADVDLGLRLRTWVAENGGGDMRFSEASLISYREQARIAVEFVRDRLEGMTTEAALSAAETSIRRTSRLFSELERFFRGVARPLRLDAVEQVQLRGSLISRHATSADRYGAAMTAEIERVLVDGLARGASQFEMVEQLVAMKGPQGMVSIRAVEVAPGVVVRTAVESIPEGLFVRKRPWAWRIVRTEVAEAQNAASDALIRHNRQAFPDLKRKIMAVIDNRTAADSLGVHGQVRAEGEEFVDGAGRHYLRPPSRPNDRETLIPWRDRWPSTRRSRPLSDAEIERITARNQARSRAQAERRRALRQSEDEIAASS